MIVHYGGPHENMIKGGNFLNPQWIITFSHLLICSLLSVDTEFLMQKKGKQGETEIQIGIQQKHELFQTFLVEVVNTYVRLGCQ